MSKAGEKIIAAAKEAVESARCRHKWERVSTRVKAGMVDGSVDQCGKCGVRRHMWSAKVPATVSKGDR